MTIVYTRQGGPPSFDAIKENRGDAAVTLGNVYVVYKGAVPVQADLDAHLNPPKPPRDPSLDPVPGVAPPSRAEFEALKALIAARVS